MADAATLEVGQRVVLVGLPSPNQDLNGMKGEVAEAPDESGAVQVRGADGDVQYKVNVQNLRLVVPASNGGETLSAKVARIKRLLREQFDYGTQTDR